MTATIAHWTIADYHAMIEAGLLVDRRVELLNGLIVEMSPEGPEHADLSTDAIAYFISSAKDRYRVRAAKPITIIDSNSEPEPDIALVKSQSYRQSHPTPDDVYLVIEFSKTSLQKDLEDKRQTYAAAGIPDYWIVNLRDHHLIILRHPSGGDYQSEQRLTSGTVSPLAFADLTIAVEMLLS
ncbi:MAG: Uma2 family endonuclease [Xenococcaceae cyanobacterium]